MSSEAGGGSIRELLATFIFGVDDKQLEKGKNKLSEFLEHVKKIGEGVIAAFAVDQIYEWVHSQAEAMSAIERTGAQLGVTTDRVQEFRFAAQSLGMQADELLNSMGRLQVSQQMAAQGSKEQAQAFHALGISISSLKGKQADELMLDVADGIAKIEDPSKRAAAAVELFGRSGRELLPFLEKGRVGVEEYFKAYRELGGGYDEEAIKASKDFEHQNARTNLTFVALKNTIAKAVLPIVTAISHALEKTTKWLNEVTKHTHIVQAALVAFGAAVLVWQAPLIAAAAPVLLLAAGIVALILALEDLYGFLTGKQSATGEILDKIFGKGAQVKILQQVKDAWSDIKDVFTDLEPVLADVWGFVKKIVEGLREIPQLKKELTDWANREDPNAILGERSKAPLTQEQREAVRARLHAREVGMLATGASLPVGYYGPLNAPPEGSSSVQVNVNVPPGLNEKQVGEHVAKQVHAVLKQERRAAAATLPRAGN